MCILMKLDYGRFGVSNLLAGIVKMQTVKIGYLSCLKLLDVFGSKLPSCHGKCQNSAQTHSQASS